MSKAEKPAEISDWRNKIDELDLALIRLLNERAHCAIEIGKIKRKLNMRIYDPKREEQIIQTVLQQNQGPLDGQGIRRLFERIIDESRRIERVTAESATRTPKQKDTKERERNSDGSRDATARDGTRNSKGD